MTATKEKSLTVEEAVAAAEEKIRAAQKLEQRLKAGEGGISADDLQRGQRRRRARPLGR